MDSVISDLTELKVSALSKSKEINKYVNDVTIGPNSLKHEKNTVNSQPAEIISVNKVDKNVLVSDAISTYSPFKEIYKNIERQRLEKIQEAMQLRHEKFLLFSREQKLQEKKILMEKKQMIKNNIQQQETMIMQALQQHEIDSSRQQEQLLKYYQEIAEKRKKNDQQIQEKEEKHRNLANLIEKVFAIQQEFVTIYTELLDTLKTCSDELKNTLNEHMEELKSLPPRMDEIISKCKTNNVCEDDAVICSDLLETAKNLKDAVDNIIDDHNKQVDEQNTKDQEQAELARLAAEAQSKVTKTESDANKDNFKLDFVSKTALKTYSDLQVFLENYVAGYADLQNNPANKSLKFDLKKAINTPVNAISDVSSHHLIDKYYKLNSLLSGNIIQMGDSNIIATKHPQGIAFAMDLLAKKFVLQGEIISSNAVAAYPYATIILSIWNNFPDFGKLFMAHLHSECPYIVPIYFPKTVDQSDQEYYQSLGYKYSDGVVETQDKFLKRMTGIMRLYCAILISHPKSGQSTHPHDLTNGWRWFTNILNLQPCIDITATLIHIFLEVCGYDMLKTYKNQFRKILQFLMDNYFDVLKRIDTGGPVTRLELLLQEYKKSGVLMPPTGLMSKQFW